jgi:aspartate carbamoyltransferase catalytic subunit
MLDETPRPVPIINAGSGADQHPTQALLDIYTLFKGMKSTGGFTDKTIVMVGDLKRGRTVRSLSRLLSNYDGVKLRFVSPVEYKISDDLRKQLMTRHISFEETTDFPGSLADADAIYMTRVQDEYDQANESKSVDYSKYHLKYEHLASLKQECMILHPLPRRNELDSAIDKDPRAVYWRQERNGMWTRVALITHMLQVDQQILLPELS